MNRYVITYNNKKLSGFDKNNMVITSQLKFSKNIYTAFDTIEQAQYYLDYIITNINPKQKKQAIQLKIKNDF